MKNLKLLLISAIILLLALCNPEYAHGTASTHIWAPSTDTQAWGTGHITADVYIPTEKNGDGSRATTITNTGLTFGMLPFKKLNAEAGFDYKTGYGNLDSYPIYLNAKLAVPEDAFKETFKYGKYLPAAAFGVYDIGTESRKTTYNVIYGELAKTFSVKDVSLGRFSIGYFWGNRDLLLDGDGESDNHGLLAAWERTMSEISDKLWLCVEYQGTKSSYGTFNLGFSWQFTPSTSVLAGYQFYNNRDLADTATIQVDINF
ncbi:MAG: hypothetical protein PHI59_01010 [Candidatus Omnitrophica bacterium]|nr:hypothetical protein [Candidatus Omnitrophota bacterium]